MELSSLTAVSPIDGRYADKTAPLRSIFSEYGLIQRRVRVEIAWLLALCDEPGLPETGVLTAEQRAAIQAIADDFSLADAQRVKEIEATTRHDVKAVEYLIREKLPADCAQLSEFIHFACTSEDINNMSHALQLRDGLAVLRAAQQQLTDTLKTMANDTIALPMLAHTHGQPASPTTLGKELAVFVHRLNRQAAQIDAIVLPAKMNGAVGNYNAHTSAAPDVDWPALSRRVIEGFGLSQNPYTTQIESHDGMAELFDALQRWNRILFDLDRDVWMYVSMKYLKQKVVAGEVGSSTMPHKINPIKFENAEANLELSSALLDSLAQTLVTSRLQRDLTDSTTQRNVGVALGHSLLALSNITAGLGQISLNRELLADDLDTNWEVLAEAIQTVVRAEITAGRSSITDPYALLKELTRGKRIGAGDLATFVEGLDIGDAAKQRLLVLTPHTYVGISSALVEHIL
jgi:adenylosuccinate lyase